MHARTGTAGAQVIDLERRASHRRRDTYPNTHVCAPPAHKRRATALLALHHNYEARSTHLV